MSANGSDGVGIGENGDCRFSLKLGQNSQRQSGNGQSKNPKMKSFLRHTGLVATLDRVNVDTDQIIPKQFLKRIERSGFGEFLFYDWRYNPDDHSIKAKVGVNEPRFAGAAIVVARAEVGCGSSCEGASWAL